MMARVFRAAIGHCWDTLRWLLDCWSFLVDFRVFRVVARMLQGNSYCKWLLEYLGWLQGHYS